MRILDDEAVRRLTARDVIETMADALRSYGRGALDAPPRLTAPLASFNGELVFAAGATESSLGYRVYGRGSGVQQATVVYEKDGGQLLGIVLGEELGARRTAGIAAVAADALARPDAGTAAIIGTGRHGYAQLWGLAAVRNLHDVRVYSRSRENRERFADRCREQLELPCTSVSDPRTAVSGADIITLATTSRTPVIDADWVAEGAHVTTLGSSTVTTHEAPRQLLDRASAIVTDSLEQLLAYSEPPWLATVEGTLERIQTLSDVVAGKAPGRRQGADITLFCSTGLSGTEVALAERLLKEP